IATVLTIIENTFCTSRFFNEENLPNSRYNLYKEWFLNSLDNEGKNFFITYDSNGEIDSLMLTSQNSSEIIIELICSKGKGKRTQLINFLKGKKFFPYKEMTRIIVGTQLDNLKAQNF